MVKHPAHSIVIQALECSIDSNDLHPHPVRKDPDGLGPVPLKEQGVTEWHGGHSKALSRGGAGIGQDLPKGVNVLSSIRHGALPRNKRNSRTEPKDTHHDVDTDIHIRVSTRSANKLEAGWKFL
jgi:hypothetical protein